MRMKHLVQLWNWLPAFRVVAQTEHLPTASRKLAISASALSRTIRLLEDEVGRPLFDRVGRQLMLNSNGRILLSATRDAMRLVDDALRHLAGNPLTGRIRIASPTAFVPVCLMPTLERLMIDYPELRPQLISCSADSAMTALLEGLLDLLITDDPVASIAPELTIELLIPIEYGIYCGAAHPLAGQATVTPDDVSSHCFVGSPDGGDHFPPEWRRVVNFECGSLDLGISICARGRHLAVLPDLVAQHHPSAGVLRRLPLTLPCRANLSAVYRTPLRDLPNPVSRVLSVLRDQLATSNHID